MFHIILIILCIGYLLYKFLNRRSQKPSQVETTQNTPKELKSFTKEELARYDGRNEKDPIYISIKGKVYDVSRGRSFYSYGSPYNVFAGKEASRAFALSSVNPEDVENTSLDDLEEEELEVLADWIDKFESKYDHVGYLIDY